MQEPDKESWFSRGGVHGFSRSVPEPLMFGPHGGARCHRSVLPVAERPGSDCPPPRGQSRHIRARRTGVCSRGASTSRRIIGGPACKGDWSYPRPPARGGVPGWARLRDRLITWKPLLPRPNPQSPAAGPTNYRPPATSTLELTTAAPPASRPTTWIVVRATTSRATSASAVSPNPASAWRDQS